MLRKRWLALDNVQVQCVPVLGDQNIRMPICNVIGSGAIAVRLFLLQPCLRRVFWIVIQRSSNCLHGRMTFDTRDQVSREHVTIRQSTLAEKNYYLIHNQFFSKECNRSSHKRPQFLVISGQVGTGKTFTVNCLRTLQRPKQPNISKEQDLHSILLFLSVFFFSINAFFKWYWGDNNKKVKTGRIDNDMN